MGIRRILTLVVVLLVCLACNDARFQQNPWLYDSFQQAPLPVVDILWVVDNSGSMLEEQDKLATNFDLFMNRLLESEADFHIGIISTDTEDPTHSGRLQGSPKVITPATSDPKTAFAANVRLPETASRTERGLDAIRLALSPELLAGDNQGFLRSGASLFVIVVTDEDDHSMGLPRYYSRVFEHMKGAGNERLVSLSAIVGGRPCGCGRDCGEPFHGIGAESGERYLQVQEQTDGLFRSICEEDYGPILQELGVNAAGMHRKYYLSATPQPATLQVVIYSEESPSCQALGDCQGSLQCAAGHRCAEVLQPLEGAVGHWVYEAGDNAIFFPGEYLPPAGSTIEVAYYRGGR